MTVGGLTPLYDHDTINRIYWSSRRREERRKLQERERPEPATVRAIDARFIL